MNSTICVETIYPMQAIFSLIIIPIIAGIIASIIAILFQSKYRLFFQFNQLCEEIKRNHDKLSDTTIQANISDMKKIHQESILDPTIREWIGFHPKEISEWIIINNPNSAFENEYRYLSSNKFRYFVLNGYLAKIPNNITHDLIRFYFLCERFSVITQYDESKILMNIERVNLKPLHKEESEFISNFNDGVQHMELAISELKPEIDRLYCEIKCYFVKMTTMEFLFKRFTAKFKQRNEEK